ncbi:hypothetical protein, partial [Belnapia moabensis]|uniref:hypothetical protein n=1 Tax=Belnapia moabensis TaxID=365533 RepID=UPI001B804F48
ATPPCSRPAGRFTFGRLISAADCLSIRAHYNANAAFCWFSLVVMPARAGSPLNGILVGRSEILPALKGLLVSLHA